MAAGEGCYYVAGDYEQASEHQGEALALRGRSAAPPSGLRADPVGGSVTGRATHAQAGQDDENVPALHRKTGREGHALNGVEPARATACLTRRTMPTAPPEPGLTVGTRSPEQGRSRTRRRGSSPGGRS